MVPIFVVEKVILLDSPAAVVASCIHDEVRFLQVTASALILPVGPQSLGREITRVNAE
jgi:hypothetical protein